MTPYDSNLTICSNYTKKFRLISEDTFIITKGLIFKWNDQNSHANPLKITCNRIKTDSRAKK